MRTIQALEGKGGRELEERVRGREGGREREKEMGEGGKEGSEVLNGKDKSQLKVCNCSDCESEGEPMIRIHTCSVRINTIVHTSHYPYTLTDFLSTHLTCVGTHTHTHTHIHTLGKANLT